MLVEALGSSKPIALVICVATTMGLRWISLRFNILSPTEVNLDKVKDPIKKVATTTKSLGNKVARRPDREDDASHRGR